MTEKTEWFTALREEFQWPERRPELEFDPHGWFAPQNRSMLRGILRRSKPTVVVELGTWLGLSARWMCDTAPGAHLVCVDHWLGNPRATVTEVTSRLPTLWDQFVANCWDYRERMTPVRMASVDGMRAAASAGVVADVVYVDASHEYEDVLMDLRTIRELWPEAAVCGDDWTWEGVRRAVEEFAVESSVEVRDYGTCWRLSG